MHASLFKIGVKKQTNNDCKMTAYQNQQKNILENFKGPPVYKIKQLFLLVTVRLHFIYTEQINMIVFSKFFAMGAISLTAMFAVLFKVGKPFGTKLTLFFFFFPVNMSGYNS